MPVVPNEWDNYGGWEFGHNRLFFEQRIQPKGIYEKTKIVNVEENSVALPRPWNPARKAAVSASLYLFFCLCYIIYSDEVAANIAHDQDQLEALQAMKGIAFMVVTALAFFAVSYFRFRKIRRNEETISQQKQTLIESERRSAAGLCAASLAHDLNNVLQAFANLREIHLHAKPNDAKFIERMTEMTNQGFDRMTMLSKRLSKMCKAIASGSPENTELRSITSEIIALAHLHAGVQDRKLLFQPGDPLSASLDIGLYEQMLFNLILNSAQAAPTGGLVEISLRKVKDEVELRVSDNGPGIPLALRKKIMEPGFTTKPQGTGLGLISVTHFCQFHEGHLIVEESEFGGADFRVLFRSQPVSNPC